MSDHYAGNDAGRGCGLMILVGIPLAVAVWFLAVVGFGRVTGWF